MKFLTSESRIKMPQAIAITMLGLIYVTIFTDSYFILHFIYQQSMDFIDFLKNTFHHWVGYGLSSF
jgi:hypothetical protein